MKCETANRSVEVVGEGRHHLCFPSCQPPNLWILILEILLPDSFATISEGLDVGGELQWIWFEC